MGLSLPSRILWVEIGWGCLPNLLSQTYYFKRDVTISLLLCKNPEDLG
jgi:hypothetical protein